VAGAGLVAREHVADPRLVQRVVDRQRRAAGQAEDGVDRLGFERGDQPVGAAHGGLPG
jgi:hypothetical protein